MAKVTGPLLSFGASGQIAKAQVYATWKGVQYARRHVIPTYTNTSGQQLTRNAFSWLQAEWKNFTADLSAPWTQFAKGQKFTNRNAFTHINLPILRSITTLAGMVTSPSTGGAPAFSNFAAAGGVGTVTISADDPTVPSGWTLVEFVASVFSNVNPQSSTVHTLQVDTDATSPYSIAFTVAAGSWLGAAFFKYTDAKGVAQYSASQSAAATAT